MLISYYLLVLRTFGSRVEFSRGEGRIAMKKSSSVCMFVDPAKAVALLGIGLVGLTGVEIRRKRKKMAVDNSSRGGLITHRLREACKCIDRLART